MPCAWHFLYTSRGFTDNSIWNNMKYLPYCVKVDPTILNIIKETLNYLTCISFYSYLILYYFIFYFCFKSLNILTYAPDIPNSILRPLLLLSSQVCHTLWTTAQPPSSLIPLFSCMALLLLKHWELLTHWNSVTCPSVTVLRETHISHHAVWFILTFWRNCMCPSSR